MLPRVQPIAPILRAEPFDDPEWIFDLKYDGFRGICYLEQGHCRLISRNGNLMSRFAGLSEQIAASLDVGDAILDGEVVAADETGRPQFYDLLRERRAPAYVAFDVIWLNGAAAHRAPAAPAEHPAQRRSDHFRGAVGHPQGARAVQADVRARPRRHCRQASEGWIRLARPVAEDQEPQLFAE
jgi:hypothetical protein